MNLKFKNITLSVIIIMVTFIVTGKDILSQNDAKIFIIKDIDLCKYDDNRFVFAVNIGEIKTTDSLFGFDIEIAYDKDKIRIINALTGNTLSEIFDEKNFSFAYEQNKIKGYATTMQMNIIPPSGNKDLIAFYAEWIGDTKCEDSALISITRLEFTDEFKKNIEKYIPGYVRTKLGTNGNISSITTDSPMYYLKSGETQLLVKYTANLIENHKVEEVTIKFAEDKVLKINDVKVKSPDVVLKSFGSDYITLRLLNQPKNFDIDVTYDFVLNGTISNYEYKTAGIILSNCNCIGNIGETSFLFTKDSTFTSISGIDGLMQYDCLKNTIIITDPKIKKIKFVDLLGRDLGNIEIEEPTEINLDNISANVIFALIEVNNKLEIKKIYKCY